MTADPDLIAALQAALAGEHAGVWASGRAAGELTGRERTAALRGLDAHRVARELLRQQLVSLDATPTEAAPAYVEPFPVDDAAGGRRLLAHVDTALTATYADVAAAQPPAGRRASARAAVASAVQALAWGAEPEAFPGE